jgi:hypothetical protein
MVEERPSELCRPGPTGEAVGFLVVGWLIVLISFATVAQFGVGWLNIVAAVVCFLTMGWLLGFVVAPRWNDRQVRAWQFVSFRSHRVCGDSALTLAPIKIGGYSFYCAAVDVHRDGGCERLLIRSSICSDLTKATNKRLDHQRLRDAESPDRTGD